VDARDVDAAELGRRLRTRRSLLGRTIASVALEAGLSVPYVANLENGRGNPTLAAVRRLAAALGIPLRELLDGGEPAAAASPAGLRRFSEQPWFRQQVRWLAAELGTDQRQLRARLLEAMAAVARALDPARPLEAADWQRLLDALVLTLLPRR
jgi:transcriptional regulator with XRE-family HTH domain